MTEPTADLHVRLPLQVKLRIDSAKGARRMTTAEYITKLVELHEDMVLRDPKGPKFPLNHLLKKLGLEAVKT